jgi:hypothetical protein
LKHFSELKYQLELGSIEERGELVQNLISRIRAEHMLDFAIWHFLNLKQRILRTDKNSKLPYEEKRQSKINDKLAQKYFIGRMKDLLVKIEKVGSLIFENTTLVEQDELYIIDPEHVPMSNADPE